MQRNGSVLMKGFIVRYRMKWNETPKLKIWGRLLQNGK